MDFCDVAILMPGSSLDDLPVCLNPAEAASVLGAWTLAWHPALLVATGRLPTWHPADAPPEYLPETLILVPSPSADQLPAGWIQRIEADSTGAVLVRHFQPRPWDIDPIIPPGIHPATTDTSAPDISPAHQPYPETKTSHAPAPDRCQAKGSKPLPPSGDHPIQRELISDFFALGFSYLMVEVLTRHMRYASNLDTIQLQELVRDAATAAVAGDSKSARVDLGRAFDTLSAARDYIYPNESYLIDVTLIDPSWWGAPFRARLTEPTPTNVLVSGQLIEQMAQTEPESIATLRNALEHGTACLVGGEYEELDWELIPSAAGIENLARGRTVLERILGRAPKVYARRRFQVVPILPQLLASFGYEGALVATFDGRQLPSARQSKTRWSGGGNAAIDALWRVPADAAAAETLFHFGRDASEALDRDYVATLLYAGWPGAASPWYDDLRRATQFTPALGKFVTLETFFETSAGTDIITQPNPNAGRDALSRLAPNCAAISAPLTTWERHACRQRQKRLAALVAAAGGGNPSLESTSPESTSLTHLLTRIVSASPSPATDSTRGRLLVNPCGRARTIHSADSSTTSNSDSWGEIPIAYLDHVPAYGFAWQEHDPAPPPPAPLATRLRLQNESIQVGFDEFTGAIRGIGLYRDRRPRLAQQIAFRAPGSGPADYSVMAADSVRITAANGACGEMTSEGRLLDRTGTVLAEFRQRTRLGRACQYLLIDIELVPRRLPELPRHEFYYALRFAWPESDHDIYRSLNGSRQPTEREWILAQDFLDLRRPTDAWTLFPMGLPIHRRVGPRMLDSLLIVAGESRRRFRCAVGIEIPVAHVAELAAALYDGADPCQIESPQPIGGGSAWLIQINAPNVVIANIEQRVDKGSGLIVDLFETIGQTTTTAFRCARKMAAARRIRLAGEPIDSMPVDADAISLRFQPFEWIRIEIDW